MSPMLMSTFYQSHNCDLYKLAAISASEFDLNFCREVLDFYLNSSLKLYWQASTSVSPAVKRS